MTCRPEGEAAQPHQAYLRRTGSAVVYFLQPTLGAMMVAMAFLGSVPLGRTLVAVLVSVWSFRRCVRGVTATIA